MIRLTFPELGMPTDPGCYQSRYGVIEVTADDLWIWSKHPNAAFVVMQPSPYSKKTVQSLLLNCEAKVR
jgi:hypothetical protein